MRGLVYGILGVAVIGCGGGGDGGTGNGPTPADITLSISAGGTMASFGDTRTITAVVRDASDVVIPSPSVTWTVSPAGVVTLGSASGLSTTVTATGNGTATVTAHAGTVTEGQAVTVTQQLAALVLTPPTATVNVDETQQLTATPQDARGNPMTLSGTTYSSDNDAVATVSASGLVTGVSVGTTKIIAVLNAQSTEKRDTTDVTVTDVTFPTNEDVTATTSLAFVPPTVDIVAGGSVTWTFESVTHNVTFASASGAPANIGNSTSTTAARTFSTAGTFNYSCTLHTGMNGTVVVH